MRKHYNTKISFIERSRDEHSSLTEALEFTVAGLSKRPNQNNKMIKIFHNPRCRKSREGLAVLESQGVEFEIVKYLDNPPTFEELKSIINKIGIKPLELVRTKEDIWKSDYKGKNLSDDEIIKAMVENPKLIERPIVIKDKKAVLGRPAEKIKELF